MRVLPGDWITAPRLPFEKSYSLRMIVLRFAATSFARRNNSNAITALCVDDHQDSSQSIHAKRDKALFTLGIRIFNCQGAGIAQRLLGIGKRNTMLAKIRLGLRRIEFKFILRAIMHIICILSRKPVDSGFALKCREQGVERATHHLTVSGPIPTFPWAHRRLPPARGRSISPSSDPSPDPEARSTATVESTVRCPERTPNGRFHSRCRGA